MEFDTCTVYGLNFLLFGFMNTYIIRQKQAAQRKEMLILKILNTNYYQVKELNTKKHATENNKITVRLSSFYLGYACNVLTSIV